VLLLGLVIEGGVIGFELPVGDMTPFLVLPTLISLI
jgi:hypothetical protein